MLLQRLDDHLQPVLVKEVRQSLRGRLFTIAFVLALGLGVVLAFTVLVESRGRGNAMAVMPILFVLVAALLVYVPFHALQSMRQEESDGARDLISLSPLGPWRVVLGKLYAALVVGGLILAAFGPFLAVSAMMPAVDTVNVLVFIAHVTGVAVLLVALGVAAGAAQTNRASRGASTALLSFLLVGVFAAEMNVLEGLLRGSGIKAPALIGTGWFFAAALAPLVLGFAASTIARDDRDVSTGLRRAWALAVGAAALMFAAVMPLTRAGPDEIGVSAILVPLFGTFVAAFVCTEHERLDGDARRRIARRRGLRRTAVVLTSHGGGRGAALTLALGVLVTLAGAFGVGLARSIRPGVGQLTPSTVVFVGLVATGTSLFFALLPARLAVGGSGVRAGARARRIQRWTSALSLLGLSLFLPFLLVLFTGGNVDPEDFFFSPLMILVTAAADASSIGDAIDDSNGTILLWAGIALVGYALALPAALRGLAEGRRVRD